MARSVSIADAVGVPILPVRVPDLAPISTAHAKPDLGRAQAGRAFRPAAALPVAFMKIPLHPDRYCG
jgi:hypothetical protein